MVKSASKKGIVPIWIGKRDLEKGAMTDELKDKGDEQNGGSLAAKGAHLMRALRNARKNKYSSHPLYAVMSTV